MPSPDSGKKVRPRLRLCPAKAIPQRQYVGSVVLPMPNVHGQRGVKDEDAPIRMNDFLLSSLFGQALEHEALRAARAATRLMPCVRQIAEPTALRRRA